MTKTKFTDSFFIKLAKATKLPKEFILEQFEEKKEQFVDTPEDKFEDAVLYALTTALKMHKKSSAIMTEGVILGVSKPFDWNTKGKNIQKKALLSLLEEYDTTAPTPAIIQRLIEKGFADSGSPEKIIWLDTKKSFNSGKANPNFGKPWKASPETAIMNVVGFAKPSLEVEGKKVEIKKFSITVSDAERFEDKGGLNNLFLIEPFTTFKIFSGKLLYYPDKSDDKTNVFNLSSLTNLEYNEDPLDVLALCKKFIPSQVQTVTSLHEHYEKFENSSEDFVVFEAGVQTVRHELSPIRTRRLYVDDPYADPFTIFTDEGMVPDTLIEVPEHIEIDFLRGSRVIIVGVTKQKAKWIKEEDGVKAHQSETEMELYVEALGIYPIPEYSIKAPKAEPVAAPEDEGWN